MLNQVYYGNTSHDWLISLAIIVGAMVLNKIIILLNKHVIQKLTEKTNNRLDDILFKMLQAPVLFGIALFAIWIATKRLNLDANFEKIIFVSYQILIVLNVTWFVARLVNALIEEYWIPKTGEGKIGRLDSHLISIIRRTILTVIWAIGAVMALNSIGVDVRALLGGLGIGGLAFALAAQDTIKNIFGGITIFTDRPFRIGDRVKVDKFEGFVEDIGIRSTRIRTLEKRLVTIPNFKMVDAPIENITDEPMRRVLMKLGLTYKTPPEKMNEAMEILKNIPQYIQHIDSKEISASFTDFTDFALVITYVYFIKKKGDVMDTASLVNSHILKTFKESDIQFAYPTQTIQIEKIDASK
jgi:MscS family membrane protein